ncbi:hypothetical protein [Salinigranum marinum]|uniref:hypothetical protein n=1 Tax=Salinigranum marinum TaxID=1515595 RepID=UPI002989D4FB|nr:hypothetical protein [Salinigranum marinum]
MIVAMVPDDTPSTRDRTRRAFLRTGTGMLTAGLATLTAGCTSALPPLGARQHFGRVNVPPAADPTYRRWLPAPGSIDGFDAPEYRFLLRQPTELDYPAPVRFTTPRKRLVADLDYLGVGYADYDRLLRTPFGTVLDGGFDPAAVRATLDETGYRRDGSYAGYDVFARADAPRRAVLVDGAVVWASNRVHDHPTVAALVDAHEGNLPRYHEEREAFERVTDAIGESRMVEHIPPNDVRTWTSAEGFRFDGDTAYHVRTFCYPEGETPPEDELRRRSKTGTVLTREVEDTDFRIDGRLVTVEGRIPPGEGVQPSAVDPSYPPHVTWGSRRGSETVRIRHEAGESVAATDLALSFDVARADGRWSDPVRRLLSTDLDRVTPGDAVTVDVSDVPEVTVIRPADVDPEVDDPYANGDSRPATRLELRFAPDTVGRTLFSVELGAGR